MNVNKNSYTIGFACVMVVFVARYIDIFEEELEYELYDVADTLRK